MYRKTEALIPNTDFEARMDENGRVMSYRIYPQKWYKLHEITLDEAIVDEESLKETGEIKKGFTTSYVTAGAEYDFEKNEREIYAVKAGEK